MQFLKDVRPVRNIFIVTQYVPGAASLALAYNIITCDKDPGVVIGLRITKMKII